MEIADIEIRGVGQHMFSMFACETRYYRRLFIVICLMASSSSNFQNVSFWLLVLKSPVELKWPKKEAYESP